MPTHSRVSIGSIRPIVVMALVALALAPLALACSRSQKPGTQPEAVNAPPSAATAAAPTTPLDDSPLAEFRMHGADDGKGKPFDMTGKIIVMGVDPTTNVMQSPNNKDDVAYYDFTTHPGNGCSAPNKCANTVLSGHVDWFTKQTGVFWNLKDLKNGDEIDVKLTDGVSYKYKVVANTVYKDEDAPVQEILGDTPQESVTLITCAGDFDPKSQEYNNRRVVRAVREA
ncbi:MAG TPA: class F sortase [Dehalococcoidia bacterium]|nr:class F sortase [Dehalococcoidia bacterium]